MPILSITYKRIYDMIIAGQSEGKDVSYLINLHAFIIANPEPRDFVANKVDIKNAISLEDARRILENAELASLRESDLDFGHYLFKIHAGYAGRGIRPYEGGGGAGAFDPGRGGGGGAGSVLHVWGAGAGGLSHRRGQIPRKREVKELEKPFTGQGRRMDDSGGVPVIPILKSASLPNRGHLTRFRSLPCAPSRQRRRPSKMERVGPIEKIRIAETEAEVPFGLTEEGDAIEELDISGESYNKIRALMRVLPENSYVHKVYQIIRQRLSRYRISSFFDPNSALEFVRDPLEVKPILMLDAKEGVLCVLKIVFALTNYYDSWLYFDSLTKYPRFRHYSFLKTLAYLPYYPPDPDVLRLKLGKLDDLFLDRLHIVMSYFCRISFSGRGLRGDIIENIIYSMGSYYNEIDTNERSGTDYVSFLTAWFVLDNGMNFPSTRMRSYDKASFYYPFSIPQYCFFIPFIDSLPFSWDEDSNTIWAESLFSYPPLIRNLLDVLARDGVEVDPSLNKWDQSDLIIRIFTRANKVTRTRLIFNWVYRSWDLFNLPISRVMISIQLVLYLPDDEVFYRIWKRIGNVYKKFDPVDPADTDGVLVYPNIDKGVRETDALRALDLYCLEGNDGDPRDSVMNLDVGLQRGRFTLEGAGGFDPERGGGDPYAGRRRSPFGPGRGAGDSYPGRGGGDPYGGGGGGAGFYPGRGGY